MPDYEIDIEFIELAKEIIDDFVPESNAVWQSIANDTVPNPSEPFKTERGLSTSYPVSIVFIPKGLENKELLKYRRFTEVPEGHIVGLMYKTDFVPTLKDICKWNGREYTVRAIDEITPIEQTILYIIEFET